MTREYFKKNREYIVSNMNIRTKYRIRRNLFKVGLENIKICYNHIEINNVSISRIIAEDLKNIKNAYLKKY
jgi:hypothetical protein